MADFASQERFVTGRTLRYVSTEGTPKKYAYGTEFCCRLNPLKFMSIFHNIQRELGLGLFFGCFRSEQLGVKGELHFS